LKQRVEQDWKSPRYQHQVRPIQRSEPDYPPAVFAAGVTGWVMVDFEISNEGKVVDPLVLDSDPPFVFEGAALAATRTWVYEKAVEPSRATVTVRFDIDR
jgi:protein TonB